tara:strand:- start:268 stop:504 length:237 start_codon:yes stop_codon:yes gene_type:complete
MEKEHGEIWINDWLKAPFHVDAFTARSGNVVSMTVTYVLTNGKAYVRDLEEGEAAFDAYSNAIVDWKDVLQELTGHKE